MSREIKITNGSNCITLSLDEVSFAKFIEQTKQVLNDELDYIQYSDVKDDIIFTSDYLKSSLIVMPKPRYPW